MPFFKTNSQLIYFAHVPKCGGSTIEKGLLDLGISLNFLDGEYWKVADRAWNRSSPQHIQIKHLNRLVDMEIFDHSFAVVRDPVARFVSAFHYNRSYGRLPFHLSIERFTERLLYKRSFPHLCYDNHFLPAVDIIPQNSTVFRLEDGLDLVSDWVRETTKSQVIPEFGHNNKRPPNTIKSNKNIKIRFVRNQIKRIKQKTMPKVPPILDLPTELVEQISEIYREDCALHTSLG